MAQPQAEQKFQEKQDKETSKNDEKSFKFNAHAPEFVPCSKTQIPVTGYFYPCYSYVGLGGNDGSGSGDWVYVSGVSDQDQQVQFFSNPDVTSPSYAKNVLTEDLQQKIIKQVKFDTNYED